MSYEIEQSRRICRVDDVEVDTTLVGSANLNWRYRENNLASNSLKLAERGSKIVITCKGEADGDAGEFELWGYPYKGVAHYLGSYSFDCDEAVDDDGLYMADNIDQVTASPWATELNILIVDHSDGVANLIIDNFGFSHIVALVTDINEGDASSADESSDASNFVEIWCRQF